MRTIIISEKSINDLYNDLLTETFFPMSEKVLLIKDYLDKNFRKTHMSDVSSDGYPIEVGTVDMINNRNEPIKTLQGDELLLLLDDKFHNIIKDDNDRKKFIKQIIKDWYANKISKTGVLTINYIK